MVFRHPFRSLEFLRKACYPGQCSTSHRGTWTTAAECWNILRPLLARHGRLQLADELQELGVLLPAAFNEECNGLLKQVMEGDMPTVHLIITIQRRYLFFVREREK